MNESAACLSTLILITQVNNYLLDTLNESTDEAIDLGAYACRETLRTIAEVEIWCNGNGQRRGAAVHRSSRVFLVCSLYVANVPMC